MGSKSSKANTGDPQVNVVNHLEQSVEYHEEHQLMLYLIFVITALQLLITLLKWYNRRTNRLAMKRAASKMAILSPV